MFCHHILVKSTSQFIDIRVFSYVLAATNIYGKALFAKKFTFAIRCKHFRIYKQLFTTSTMIYDTVMNKVSHYFGPKMDNLSKSWNIFILEYN